MTTEHNIVKEHYLENNTSHFIDVSNFELKILKVIRIHQKAEDCSITLKLCFGFCSLSLLGSWFQASHDYIVLERNSEFAIAQLQELKSLGWNWWQVLFVDTFMFQKYPGVVETVFQPCRRSLSLYLVVSMNESSCFPSKWHLLWSISLSTEKCLLWYTLSTCTDSVKTSLLNEGSFKSLNLPTESQFCLWSPAVNCTVHLPIGYKLLNMIRSCSIKAS